MILDSQGKARTKIFQLPTSSTPARFASMAVTSQRTDYPKNFRRVKAGRVRLCPIVTPTSSTAVLFGERPMPKIIYLSGSKHYLRDFRETIMEAQSVEELRAIALALTVYVEDHQEEFRRIGYVPPELVDLDELIPDGKRIAQDLVS